MNRRDMLTMFVGTLGLAAVPAVQSGRVAWLGGA